MIICRNSARAAKTDAQQSQCFGVRGDQGSKFLVGQVGSVIQFPDNNLAGLEQVIVAIWIRKRRQWGRCLLYTSPSPRDS